MRTNPACMRLFTHELSKVAVPALWGFRRTQSYFPLTEGTKLHFSSTWTPAARSGSPKTPRIRGRTDVGPSEPVYFVPPCSARVCSVRWVFSCCRCADSMRAAETEAELCRNGVARAQRFLPMGTPPPPPPLLSSPLSEQDSLTAGSESNGGAGSSFSPSSSFFTPKIQERATSSRGATTTKACLRRWSESLRASLACLIIQKKRKKKRWGWEDRVSYAEGWTQFGTDVINSDSILQICAEELMG